MRVLRRERGAAAVEFALIVPVLLILVFGIIEFSRLYNEQISLTNAARSAVRVMAISSDEAKATQAAIDAAPTLDAALVAAGLSLTPATCSAGATMTAAIDYEASLLTGWFGAAIGLRGEAATPCGG